MPINLSKKIMICFYVKVERSMVKNEVIDDTKHIILNQALVTSTPRERKAKSKKILLEHAAQDQAILAT